MFAKKTATWKGMNIQPYDSLVFFGSSLPVKGCCTQKAAFVGNYNNEERPNAVLKGTFKNFPLCSGEDAIGSFKHVVKLKPGQTKTFSVCLGETAGTPEITKIFNKYRNIRSAQKEL